MLRGRLQSSLREFAILGAVDESMELLQARHLGVRIDRCLFGEARRGHKQLPPSCVVHVAAAEAGAEAAAVATSYHWPAARTLEGAFFCCFALRPTVGLALWDASTAAV